MDDRMTDLEIRIAFLEQTVSELDGVVRDFADQVVQLRALVGELKIQVASPPDAPLRPSDEVPPHY